jgi:WD40 repeat protein
MHQSAHVQIKHLSVSYRQWNLLTAECIGVLHGHNGSVNAVVMTSNGYKAVSAGEDKELKVWNVDPESK